MDKILSKGKNEPYICILNERLFRSNCNKPDTNVFDDYLRLIGHAYVSGELADCNFEGVEHEIDFAFECKYGD